MLLVFINPLLTKTLVQSDLQPTPEVGDHVHLGYTPAPKVREKIWCYNKEFDSKSTESLQVIIKLE